VQKDGAADPTAADGADTKAKTANQADIDYQLARALDLIRGVAIFNVRGNGS